MYIYIYKLQKLVFVKLYITPQYHHTMRQNSIATHHHITLHNTPHCTHLSTTTPYFADYEVDGEDVMNDDEDFKEDPIYNINLQVI